MRVIETMGDRLQVRIASDDKRRLVDAARKRGLTLSDFLRETATEAARRVEA